jgi:putative adhesin
MLTVRVSSLLMACAALAAAQDKVAVPLSNPSQPATIKVRLISGNIAVTGGSGSQVVVESSARSREGRAPGNVPPGMHRLDTGRAGLDIEEDHNVVTIGVGQFGGMGNLSIQVPVNSSLELIVSSGHIEVSGVNGEMDLNDNNGAIMLKNVSGSVVAHALNGSITATLDKVTPDKPMSFTSMNGKIDVTLPADTKARLRLKTDTGSIYSDFDVKLEPDANQPVVEDARGQGGKYRIRLDRSVYGSINGGGPEYRFETLNGSILLHKK